MTSTEIVYLVLFIICLLLSAFFSGAETAFTATQRVRIEHMVSTGVPGASRVSKMIKFPGKILSSVLTGNNLVNTAAASLGTVLAISVWENWGILISTIGVSVILLIFCESTPKIMAIHNAERTAIKFSRPIQIISWVFTPVVIALNSIASRFSRISGNEPMSKALVSEEEIRTMISMGHREGTVEKAEAEMLHAVFEFGDRPVHEVMIPRPEVMAMEEGSTIADFLALYAQSPLSRFPVYQENMDNVVGVMSIKDVLMGLANNTIDRKSTIDSLVRPAYFTPESKHINELFAEMRDNNYRMAIVIDEYGGTAGVVSLSRLVEEIVGEVGDELAKVEKDYEAINDYTFQIDGSMRIEEANEEMGLKLPEGDDYETVAGLILNLLGHIPKRGEQLRYRGMKIVITKMRGLKIEEILLTKEKKAGNEPAET